MRKFIFAGMAISFAAALTASTALADLAVATAGPITGDLAANGEQMKRGAEMAVKDINAAGGILGQKLDLTIGDDACDPKQATSVAQQLVQKGVKFVAGHFCSGSSIPASKVYADAGVLQISPSSTNPKFTDEGDWNVARVCGRDDAQGLVAGNFLAKHYAGKKVAIVDDKSAYGKGLADATNTSMVAAGLKPAMVESINTGEKDYSAIVSKMKEAGIDAIYFGGYHPEGALILKQLREQGSKAQMVSGDSMNVKEFWTIAGDAADGMMFTFAPDPRNNPEAKDLVAKFKADGYDPEGYTLATYATFQVFQQAATATKSTDPKTLAAWIRGGNEMKTVLGPIKIDKKGDVIGAKYVWYVFHKGDYAEDDSIQ